MTTATKNTQAQLLFDLLGKQSRGLRIGVTSANRGEGRTSLAASLAETLSQEMGTTALLIDLDFEHPQLHERYRLNNVAGVAEVMTGQSSMSKALHRPMTGLWFLPAGIQLKQSVKLTSALMKYELPWLELAQMLDPGYVTIFDLPPLVDSLLGAQLSRLATHLVMAVEANHTPQEVVKAALRSLDESGQRDKLARAVLTKVRRATPARFAKI